MPIRGDLAGMQRIFALDQVSEFVWQRLDGKTDLQALCQAVVDRFDVSEEQAEADLRHFLADLSAAGLVVEGG